MFIQTEKTPNPETLKFIPGKTVLGKNSASFTDAQAAAASPLAHKLFQINGVREVFLGGDFISVRKNSDTDWAILKPPILGTIMEHFASGQPMLNEKNTPSQDETQPGNNPGDDDDLIKQIKDLLDTRVRPAVAMDGGDIVFERYDAGVVYLKMQGACSGCPSSTATLKMGIENMLKHYVPVVTEVRAVE